MKWTWPHLRGKTQSNSPRSQLPLQVPTTISQSRSTISQSKTWAWTIQTEGFCQTSTYYHCVYISLIHTQHKLTLTFKHKTQADINLLQSSSFFLSFFWSVQSSSLIWYYKLSCITPLRPSWRYHHWGKSEKKKEQRKPNGYWSWSLV